MAVKQARQHSIDLLTVSMFFGLILIGLFMVYSVSSPEGGIPMSQLMDSQAGKQIIWFGISSLLFFTIMLIDHRVWDTFSYVVYGISLVLLVLVLIVGKEINGAKAWFSFGSFSFQPAEIAKFGTALVMASFLGRFNTDLRKVSSQLLALAGTIPTSTRFHCQMTTTPSKRCLTATHRCNILRRCPQPSGSFWPATLPTSGTMWFGIGRC